MYSRQFLRVFVASLCLYSCSDIDNRPDLIELGPEAFLSLMVHYVEPVYPREALLNREGGVVVVQVELDIQGEIIGVQTLESPNHQFTSSVEKAASMCNYRAAVLSDGDERPSRGKLIFYFTPDTDPPLVTLANDEKDRQSLLAALQRLEIEQ